MFATSLLDMRYEIQATLSKGSTSNTKLAKDLTSQTSVAVKIFKEGSSEFTSKNKIQITREMQILQDLTHPNIVPIQVVNTTGATYFRKHGKEPYQCMYIVSELCKYGTLLDILGTQEMDERMVRYFFRQLMDALEFCHNNRICNIDLKSENVLFDHEGILKISGFCYASVIEDETQQERPRSRIEYFLPPELYEHKTCLGTQHDLYSAGILLFLMMARQQPFTRPNTRMDPIYASFYEENERYWNRLTNKLGPKNTPNYRQLMHMMLAYSPSQRLSIQEIRAHEWFQGEQAGPEEVTAFFSRIEEKSAENLQRAKRKAEEYKNRPNRFWSVNSVNAQNYRSLCNLQSEQSVKELVPHNHNPVYKFSKLYIMLTKEEVEEQIREFFSQLNREYKLIEDSSFYRYYINQGDILEFQIEISAYDSETLWVDWKKLNGCGIKFMELFQYFLEEVMN